MTGLSSFSRLFFIGGGKWSCVRKKNLNVVKIFSRWPQCLFKYSGMGLLFLPATSHVNTSSEIVLVYNLEYRGRYIHLMEMGERGWNEKIITKYKELGDYSTSKSEHATDSCLHAFREVNTIFYFSLKQFWLCFPHFLCFAYNKSLLIPSNRSQQTLNPVLLDCLVAIEISLLHLCILFS